jgi:hypothetical protein
VRYEINTNASYLQAVVSVVERGFLATESWGCKVNSPFYDIATSKPV